MPLLGNIANNLRNTNEPQLNGSNILNDAATFLTALYSGTTEEKVEAALGLAVDINGLLGQNNPLFAGLAIQNSAALFSYNVTQWATTPSSVPAFADVVASLGNLINAIGVGVVNPQIQLTGTVLNSYGILLHKAADLGSALDIHGWIDSITQETTRTEGLAYINAFAKRLDPTLTDEEFQSFIDGSADSEFGLNESTAFLKAIRKTVGFGSEITLTTADDVYQEVLITLSAIQTLYGAHPFEFVAPPTTVGQTRADLGAFLSLYHLTPFALKTEDTAVLDLLHSANASIANKWDEDRNLTSQQIADGQANFSDLYLADRAAMLSWLIKANKDDTQNPNGLGTVFIDKKSNVSLGSGAISNNPTVIFGSNTSESISGGMKNDQLYGDEGNDELFGLDGNDYLEGGIGNDSIFGDHGHDTLIGGIGADSLNGGEGNDTLIGGEGADTLVGGFGNDLYKGGEGSDVYLHSKGDGNDVIDDSDGQGSIKLNGKSVALDGGKLVKGATNLWESDDKLTRYALFDNGDGTKTLNIYNGSERLFVKDFSNGDLGINLEEENTEPPQYSPQTEDSDYITVDPGANLDGLGGNDVMIGNLPAEQLKGGEGDDLLFGQEGDDTLEGGDGNDFINGGEGHDLLRGGAGNDLISSNANYIGVVLHKQNSQGTWELVASNDQNWKELAMSWRWEWDGGTPGQRMVYLEGTDKLGGKWKYVADDPNFALGILSTSDISKSDIIYGDAGNDLLAGSTGDDYIDGGDDDDVIFGINGNDVLFGGSGNDEINGGDDIDDISGEAGDDTLYGGYEGDLISGGGGDDELIGDLPNLEGTDAPPTSTEFVRMGNDTLDGGSGHDKLWGGGGADSLIGGEGNDDLVGDGLGIPAEYQGQDTLDGGSGDDKLWGYGEDDSLLGGDGNDTIEGDSVNVAGADKGDDYLDGEAGDDYLIGDGGKDTLIGGEGNDSLFGDADNVDSSYHGDDLLDGGAGTDLLQGGGGNDTLLGGDDEDLLFGEQGNDNITGGSGEDELDGGAGNDTLDGGLGTDVLSGGEGNDIYIFNIGDGETNQEGFSEVILDSVGTNTIRFGTGVTASSLSLSSSNGYLIIHYSGSDSVAIQNGMVGAISAFEFSNGTTLSFVDLINQYFEDPINETSYEDEVYLAGGNQIDTLTAEGDNTTISGGAGDDILTNYSNNSIYLYKAGDGKDAVMSSGRNNQIKFGEGIDLTNLRLGISEDDRLELIINENDVIELRQLFRDSLNEITSINKFEFSDGTSLTYEQLLALGFDFNGTSANELIEGTSVADRITGSSGNDELNGGQGNDIYYLNPGDGNDAIDDLQGINEIVFGEDVDPASLLASQYQGDDGSYYLKLQYGIAGDSVSIKNGSAGTIQTYRFADGTVITHADLMAAANIPVIVLGTQESESLWGTVDDDLLNAADGDDVVSSLSGNDSIDGGLGQDTIYAGSGDDLIDGGRDDDELYGESGEDTFYIQWGMGRDIITDGLYNEVSYLEIGEGIELSDLTHQKINNDLLIHFKGGEEGVVIKDFYTRSQNWNLRDIDGNITVLQDFISTPAENVPSSIEERMENYLVQAKSSYFQILGKQGYALSNGVMKRTDREVNDYSSTTYYHVNEFNVSLQENDAQYISRDVPAEETSSYTIFYDVKISYKLEGSPSSNSISEFVNNSNNSVPPPLFVPYVDVWGGHWSGPQDIEPSSNVVRGTEGLWIFLPAGLTGYQASPSSSGVILTTQEFIIQKIQVDTTVTLEKILAGASDNHIEVDQYSDLFQYALVDAGAGDDQITVYSNRNHYSSIEYSSPVVNLNLGTFLYGNAGNDQIQGGWANDYIAGGDGDDTLDGGKGHDTYYIDANDSGIDIIIDSYSMRNGVLNNDAGEPMTLYMDKYYRSLGITDWLDRHLGWGEYNHRQGEGLSPLPEISPTDYLALESLYAANVLEKDTVEFGEGIELEDLVVTWGQFDPPGNEDERAANMVMFGTLDITWGNNKGVRIAVPVLDINEVTSNLSYASWYDNSYMTYFSGAEWFLGAGIERFKFADGTLLSMAEFLEIAPPMPSVEAIEFDLGNNYSVESYLWKTLIKFEQGISPLDIRVSRDGQDMLFSHVNGVDQLRIQDWFSEGNSTPRINAKFYGEYETSWSPSDIELLSHFLYGTNQDDSIYGSNETDYIFGGDGNDHLQANSGNGDELYGESGNDTLDGSLTDRMSAYGGDGNDLIIGGNGDDYLSGEYGNDSLIGGNGSDSYVISTDPGHDVVDETGAGTEDYDQIYIDAISSDVILQNDGADLMIIYGEDRSVRLLNWYQENGSTIEQISFSDGVTWDHATIEAMAPVNDSGQYLTGTNVGDSLIGSSGDDTIDGGLGKDTMQGGQGDDIYLVDNEQDVVVELSDEGQDWVHSEVSYTLSNHIENLSLFSAAYAAIGNSQNNLLVGNGAENLLDGAIGADTLMGGGGDDAYVVDSILDVISENANEGTDSVYSSVSYTLTDNVERLFLTGESAINGVGNTSNNDVYGNSANNHLDGYDGNDTLNGGAGADTMLGGMGNDTYWVDNPSDVIIELEGEGYDAVYSEVDYVLHANFEALYLWGNAVQGIGNSSNNFLLGTYGNNLLYGAEGNDTLNGMPGSDTLFGGEGNDTYYLDAYDVVEEYENEGIDRVSVAFSYTLGDNIENLGLGGSADINGNGNALNNMLDGNSGNNELYGWGGDDSLTGWEGSDTLIGGIGNDSYWIDSLSDVIVESVSAGVDSVYSDIDGYVLGSNLENLFTSVSATGNDLNNLINSTMTRHVVLDGGDGDDTLIGNSGWDTLIGGSGNDVLDGGGSFDILIGGQGDDIYIVNNPSSIIELDGEGVDVVRASVNFILENHVEHLLLTGNTSISGVGNNSNNFILGNSAENTLSGNGGRDILQGMAGNDGINGNGLLDGGEGDDGFSGGDDNSFIIGGSGNDNIYTGIGQDIVAFNLGDGQDTINASSGMDNILSLGGIDYDHLRFNKEGEDLVMHLNTSDSLRFKYWYLGSKSIEKLQIIAKSMEDFSSEGSNTLLDNKIEIFDFVGLVNEYDEARATDANLTDWALTDSLLEFHLSGSDEAAFGGDLAYQYAMNGSLAGIAVNAAQSIISETSFGQSTQLLQPLASLQEGSVKLS